MAIQSTTPTLDPDALRLAKAIRQVETGNRPVKGASGELASRYQFMPGTWKAAAKEILGDENAELSLENENKVAYTRIKKWKDQGMSPAQIAAMWNSGTPTWEGKVGVNKAGVKYDVPGYVNKVGGEYKKLKATEPPPPAQQVTQPKNGGILGAVGGFLKGVAKGAGSTIAGAEKLGGKIIEAPIRALGGKPPELKGVFQQFKEKGTFTPEGTAQKVGFGAEQIAEYLLPGLAPTKAIKVGAGASKLAKVGAATARLGVTAAETAGRSAIQKGTTEDFGKDLTTSAAVIGGLGAAGLAAKGVGKLLVGTLGKTTGAGSKAVSKAAESKAVMSYARQASRGEAEASKILEGALNIAKSGKKARVLQRGNEYLKSLNRLKAEKVDYGEILQGAKMKAIELFDEFSIKVNKKGNLTPSSFRSSPIGEGRPQVVKALNLIKTWKDTTPAGLDTLKKRLGQHLDAVRTKTDGSFRFIRDLRSQIDQGLKVNIPGYKEMVAKYASQSTVIDEIERILSLSDRASRETSIRKLLSTLNDNQQLRNEMLKALGRKRAEEITERLSGLALSSWTPTKGLAGGIGGLAALFTVSDLTRLLPILAGSSPRLVGEAMALIGSVKGKIVPPKTREAFLGLLMQAMREDVSPSDRPETAP